MKRLKRLMSIFLAVIMVTALFGIPGTSYANDALVPRDPSNFTYDEMIAYFQQQMKRREENISCSFDTYDLSFIDMAKNDAPRFGVELYDKIMLDVFTNCYSTAPDPQLGDYLYNSISYIQPLEGMRTEYADLNGGHYVTFDISFKFEYYSTYEQEERVSSFIATFNRMYMNDNMTEYEKVKTIYDFVVRNATYDHDVFNNVYPLDSERYMISHSAYGAVFGNLIADGKSDADFKYDYKTTFTNEKIVQTADQGLAVCEGYSKLFYALCVSQGIECRIVDGDNVEESGKSSDPHEWNYVWLDDGVKEDGARWYQIDTTFASQNSMKKIDMQSYDFFLRGYNSVYFGYNHQMPYENYGYGLNVKEQLYDWYADENLCSADDYDFPPATFNVEDEVAKGYILRRTTNYEGDDEERVSYIFTDLEQSFFVAIDENGDPLLEEIEGFGFTGVESRFDVLIPYLIPSEEYYVQAARATAAGDGYYVAIKSESDTTGMKIPFKIVPRDMSNNSDNYSVTQIQRYDSYSGAVVHPQIELVDGYKNTLAQGRDFDVYYYSDEDKTTTAVLKNIGTYWCDIIFKGNYSGVYSFSFAIGKADLSRINHPDVSFQYYPEALLQSNNIKTPKDFYLHGASNINIEGLSLTNDVDYEVRYSSNSTNNLDWGASGTISLVGLSSSDKVEGGSATTFNYKVDQKYDISRFNGKNIDGVAHHYTGSAVYPDNHSGIDTYLVEGKDYKVVSYSDNVNVGKAKVTIQGINGCTGTIVMYYEILPLSVANATVNNVSLNNGKLSYSFYYGSRLLSKNTDYSEKVETTTSGYKLTLTGKGNYTSSYIININVKQGSSTPVIKTPTVKKTKLKKLKAGKKSIAVTWAKVSGNVTGYRIEYSTSSKFTKKTTKKINVKGAKKTSYTIKKLKSKKKYYVRVRTYYTKNKVNYLSSCSNVKSIKAK